MTATNSGFRWTPSFRGLLQDPYVQEEFDRLAAQLKAAFDEHTRAEAEKGLDTGATINTLPSTDAGDVPQTGIRWMEGPWLLNADGDLPGKAVIRPPMILSTQNDYAPLGLDTCIGMGLTGDADRTITGIRVAKRQTRLLYVLNAGDTYSFTFPSNDTSSLDIHRFGLGAAGDTLVLPPGRVVWFFYDVVAQLWRLFALPAVAFSGLPGEINDTDFDFPVDYDWGGAKCYDGVSAAGLGEPAPTLAGTGSPRSTVYGNFRNLASAAVAGSSAGVDAGGSSLINYQHNPIVTFLIRTGSDISNVRIYATITNTALADTDDLQGISAAAEYVGWRFSTVVPDAQWVAVSSDGVAQAVTQLTGFANAADAIQKLRMRTGVGGIYFSINNSAEILVSARLPSPTTQLFWTTRVFTQVGVARTLSWSRTFWRGQQTP